MVIIPYILLKGIWSYYVKKDGDDYGMDGRFWFLTALIIPLWIGFYLYFSTRNRVLESKKIEPKKKHWPIIESILLLVIIGYLLFKR